MRVERSASGTHDATWVRHFDSRIARQTVLMNEPHEATLLYDVKSRLRCRRKPVFLSILVGGAYRDRTDDPLLAKQMLSQLS